MAQARLADLLVALSRVGDLGFGLPVGTAARSAVLAARLAQSCQVGVEAVRVSYYTALLHHVGCVGYAHETSQWFGDELAVNRAAAFTNTAAATDMVRTFLPLLTQGRPLARRARLVAAALIGGHRWGDAFTRAACEIGRDTAGRLGLPVQAQQALFHVYDQWRPERRVGALAGEQIPLPARIARLSAVAVLIATVAGEAEAMRAIRSRSGGMLDPDLTRQLAASGTEWLDEIRGAGATVTLEHEPDPHVIGDVQMVAAVFGDLADVACPIFAGHSRGVARLASGAAEFLRWPGTQARDAAVGGHLLDVGRVAVSCSIWERAGPLGPDEWEQIRLHPYHSERILAASTTLAALATQVGHHHERLDGTGYFRGARAVQQSPLARLLATADTYQTAREPRPHRPALSRDAAARRLREDAHAGRFDEDIVEAVLTVARGCTTPQGRTLGPPRGLSPREVEVLRLLAHGMSSAQIAARLVLSRRTVEHHVEHIFAKLGVSNRAAATLHAAEHGLLAEMGSPTDAPHPRPGRQ